MASWGTLVLGVPSIDPRYSDRDPARTRSNVTLPEAHLVLTPGDCLLHLAQLVPRGPALHHTCLVPDAHHQTNFANILGPSPLAEIGSDSLTRFALNDLSRRSIAGADEAEAPTYYWMAPLDLEFYNPTLRFTRPARAFAMSGFHSDAKPVMGMTISRNVRSSRIQI